MAVTDWESSHAGSREVPKRHDQTQAKEVKSYVQLQSVAVLVAFYPLHQAPNGNA